LDDRHDAGRFDYTQFTFTFTATSNFTAVQFGFTEQSGYFFLDDISVTPPVPVSDRFNFTSPAVVATTPPAAATVTAPFNHVRVIFDRPMDPTSVASANITLTDPAGGAIPLTFAAAGLSNTVFDVTFADQNTVGFYTLAISTGVHDPYGNAIIPFVSRVFNVVLVTNGDFETGNFTGWTRSGVMTSTGVTGTVGSTDPHGGSFQAFFGPSTGLGFISQNLSTTVGVSYTLSFWLAHPYASDPMTEWLVSVGDTTLMDEHASGNFDYTQFTFTFTATSSTTALQFGFRTPPGFFLLDDVSVTPT
jgi:hypothetical protein